MINIPDGRPPGCYNTASNYDDTLIVCGYDMLLLIYLARGQAPPRHINIASYCSYVIVEFGFDSALANWCRMSYLIQHQQAAKLPTWKYTFDKLTVSDIVVPTKQENKRVALVVAFMLNIADYEFMWSQFITVHQITLKIGILGCLEQSHEPRA